MARIYGGICLLFVVAPLAAANKLTLTAKEVSSAGLTVDVAWDFHRRFPTVSLAWEAVTYASQVSYHRVGKYEAKSGSLSERISNDIKLDQQYRICATGSDPKCSDRATSCGYIRVMRLTKVHQGPHLYLVFAPVNSDNITVTWSLVPKESGDPEKPKSDVGYRLSWRRVEGRVGGHPGHSTIVVSSTHIVKGLQPATRYEICVSEALVGKGSQTCDFITTEEDLPGPPVADESTCYTQARGTHWRCDVTWSAPKKTNGKILGYIVSWLDQEGYALLESAPRGVLCDPMCFDSQVLTFHPHEVCIRAKTSNGLGWESCADVTDLRSRLMSLIDSRVWLIVAGSILAFKFGTRFLKAVFRCCVRGLYKQIESEKEHPI